MNLTVSFKVALSFIVLSLIHCVVGSEGSLEGNRVLVLRDIRQAGRYPESAQEYLSRLQDPESVGEPEIAETAFFPYIRQILNRADREYRLSELRDAVIDAQNKAQKEKEESKEKKSS